MNEQASVVELAVVVGDAAAQALGLERRQSAECFGFREELRRAEVIAAGESVVEFQAEAVERRGPPRVAGDDERAVVDQVRGVSPQPAALAQRLQNQPDAALAEIAHAAVDQLGAAAGGALAEVAAFEEQHRVAAGRGVHGDAGSGRAAADDDQVPRLAPVEGTVEHRGAVHGGLSPLSPRGRGAGGEGDALGPMLEDFGISVSLAPAPALPLTPAPLPRG